MGYPLGRFFGVRESGVMSLAVWTRQPAPSPVGAYFLYEWEGPHSPRIVIQKLVKSTTKEGRARGERSEYQEADAITLPNWIPDVDPDEAQKWVRQAMEDDAKNRFGVVDWILYDTYGNPTG